MALSNPALREDLAIFLGTKGAWISFHTSDPGTTGANEASGSGYARVQTTWTGGAVDGTVNGSEVTITVPAGTWTWCGIWSASTSGTWVDKFQVNANTLSVAGTIKVTPALAIA